MTFYTEEPDCFAYNGPLSVNSNMTDVFKTIVGWQACLKSGTNGYNVRDVEDIRCIFTGMKCDGDCRACKVAFEPQFAEIRAKVYAHRLSELKEICGIEARDGSLFVEKDSEQVMPKKYKEEKE